MTINIVAHNLLIRAYQTGRDIATFNAAAERDLIDLGYAAYIKPPLMRITEKGIGYAKREIASVERYGRKKGRSKAK